MPNKKVTTKTTEVTAEYVEKPETANKTIWNEVGNAVIGFIEPKANTEWFTAEDVFSGAIASNILAPISGEKIKEIIADVLTLLTANHLLIQKDDQYRKFTLDEVAPGGIAIEHKKGDDQ